MRPESLAQVASSDEAGGGARQVRRSMRAQAVRRELVRRRDVGEGQYLEVQPAERGDYVVYVDVLRAAVVASSFGHELQAAPQVQLRRGVVAK